MSSTRGRDPVRLATGVIREVDVPGRELTVAVGGTTQTFDVRAECSILLQGEPVKLRLLLAGDAAQVAYHEAGGRLVAMSIRVNWRLSRPDRGRRGAVGGVAGATASRRAGPGGSGATTAGADGSAGGPPAGVDDGGRTGGR